MVTIFAIVAVVTGMLGARLDPPKKCEKWRWTRNALTAVLMTCSMFSCSAAVSIAVGYKAGPQSDSCHSEYDGRGGYMECEQ